MTKAKNEISVISSNKDILDIQAMKTSEVGNKQIEEMPAEAACYKVEKRHAGRSLCNDQRPCSRLAESGRIRRYSHFVTE